MRQMWEEFFPAAQQTGEASGPLLSKLADEQRLSTVLARHQAALMSYPNVVGVAIATDDGKPKTGRFQTLNMSMRNCSSWLSLTLNLF